jgi:hypothetical protein
MESMTYERSSRNHLGTLGTCRFRADAHEEPDGEHRLKAKWRVPITFAEFRRGQDA